MSGPRLVRRGEAVTTVYGAGDEYRFLVLHVPKGVLHNFRNDTDSDARMLLMFAPAGIEKMFERMARDPDDYAEIGAEYGVTFPDVDG